MTGSTTNAAAGGKLAHKISHEPKIVRIAKRIANPLPGLDLLCENTGKFSHATELLAGPHVTYRIN